MIPFSPPWPDSARAWLAQFGNDHPLSDNLVTRVNAFAPQSLKQVFTSALALASEAGCLDGAMHEMGHREAELRRLRDVLGIPRTAPLESLPTALVILPSDEGFMAPRRWVPDVLDRAAVQDVMARPDHAAGDEADIMLLETTTLAELEVQHVLLIGAGAERHAESVAALIPTCQVHIDTEANRWLEPGPELTRVIFETASRIHARPELCFQARGDS